MTKKGQCCFGVMSALYPLDITKEVSSASLLLFFLIPLLFGTKVLQ